MSVGVHYTFSKENRKRIIFTDKKQTNKKLKGRCREGGCIHSISTLSLLRKSGLVMNFDCSIQFQLVAIMNHITL